MPAWLGRGLERLVGRFPDMDSGRPRARGATPHAEVVIVGSGYGAAVAARELSRCWPAPGQDGPIPVCILERGAEYPPGAFPARLAELPGHIRFSTPAQTSARGVRGGLFDVRIGADALAVVANGVGGGSLINAGVMLRPDAQVMKGAAWPKALHAPGVLDRDYDTVAEWLGAGAPGQPNDVCATQYGPLDKTLSLFDLGRDETDASPVPITVALKDGTKTVAGIDLKRCIGCGDCATGCNHGAKNSLDIGLLAQACASGAQLYTGATVLRLQAHPGGGWIVVVQHTDELLRRRQGAPFRLHARRVIVAAGTFGSTEILLRSRRHGLALSPRLGQRFSTNGDLIASVHGREQAVHAVADENVAPASRQVGPTITAMVEVRPHETDRSRDFVIQDLAVPGPLRRAFEELYTTAATLDRLPNFELSAHGPGDPDPCAVDPNVIARSLPVAMIGHDDADGVLRLTDQADTGEVASARRPETGAGANDDDEGDGALQIHWPTLSNDPRWPAQHELLAKRAAAGQGGRVLANPAWRLLPASMAKGYGVPNGPLITVHPLGGCAMGDDCASGVVDDCGRVYDPGAPPNAPPWHSGLVVLDGSIVPSSLGINPALTIAALAHRAVQRLRGHWGLVSQQALPPASAAPPPFRDVSTPVAAQPTRIELVERMRGPAACLDGSGHPACIELTLYSQPTDIAALMQHDSPRGLTFDPTRSRLRVLRVAPGPADDEPGRNDVLLDAPLRGTLTVFTRGTTRASSRIARGFAAFVLNRGVRDTCQLIREKLSGTGSSGDGGPWALFWGALKLASHAGAKRELVYTLAVDGAATGPLRSAFPLNAVIGGRKTLVYACAAYPLQQLMEMTLTAFPTPVRPSGPLELQMPFLAARGVPLLRIVGQQDQPSALVDFASLLAYTMRTLVDGHLWSFRKPDALPAGTRAPQRLPGTIPGLPPPAVTEIDVAELVRDTQRIPVRLRLTRYLPTGAATQRPPVLMIHGYSASGTTYAHPTLKPGLMGHLCRQHRRDVWILDMRSSCGMPTATEAWAFEDMGCEDIPVAIDHLCRATGHARVDVVAHCMSVPMLFMGLLGSNGPGLAPLGRHEALRAQLPQRIRRLVMSQVGPTLLLTPGNVGRAYLMRYVKQFIMGGGYEFRPSHPERLNEQLLDRLLCGMTYPSDEFARENPLWPLGKVLTWVGVRHRIDALYGRAFNLAHLRADTLDCIDDFFGPFNVDTVSQAMYFARHRLITDRYGFNRFVEPGVMRQRLDFPMLSLHAAENGLVDAGTEVLMQAVVGPNVGPNGSLRTRQFAGLGHQDSLIGEGLAVQAVFDEIADFLQQP